MAILTDLAITETGDLLIVDNDFALVYGQDAMMQKVRIVLNTHLGEYQLDTSIGIPYFPNNEGSSVLGKRTSQADREAIIKDALLNIDGVETIISFEFDVNVNTRALTVTTELNTNEGIIDVEVSL